NDRQARERLSRSQWAAPLHSTAQQSDPFRSSTSFLASGVVALNRRHKSVRDFRSFHSLFSTMGIAFSTLQQTGDPPLSGAHFFPQSYTLEIGAWNRRYISA